jgi:hypothetical protein
MKVKLTNAIKACGKIYSPVYTASMYPKDIGICRVIKLGDVYILVSEHLVASIGEYTFREVLVELNDALSAEFTELDFTDCAETVPCMPYVAKDCFFTSVFLADAYHPIAIAMPEVTVPEPVKIDISRWYYLFLAILAAYGAINFVDQICKLIIK